ncbi:MULTISPECIES: LMxysn_1693 family intestinal colonization protein [Oceanobacillus]
MNEGPSIACASCNQYKSSIVSQTLISRKYTGTVTLSRSTTLSMKLEFKYKGINISFGGKTVSSSSKKFKEYKVTKNYKIRVKTYNPRGRLLSNEVVTKKLTSTERVPI